MTGHETDSGAFQCPHTDCSAAFDEPREWEEHLIVTHHLNRGEEAES